MPSVEASLQNLEKAKANWRRPRPFRSAQESRVIRRLVWQWLNYCGPKWSARAVGRRLGVSHTYIQRLVREFADDLNDAQRMAAGSSATTFDELRRAQQETQRQKDLGRVRWKRIELLQVPQDIPIWAEPSASAQRAYETRPWLHAGSGGWMY